MCKARIVTAVLWALAIVEDVASVTVPQTPCPRLFNYFEDSNSHQIFGSIKLPNDLSGNYTLEIDMTIAADVNGNIRIHRKTTEAEIKRGRPIEYYIFFPLDHTFPTMTMATFNGKVYCKGPPQKATEGKNVTALSTKDTFKTALVTSLSNNSPVVYNNINDPECGVNKNYEALIYSGDPTKRGQYPWLVAIFIVQGIGGYTFICGGNLVSNKHVVTASHCMQDVFGVNVPKEDLVLVLGAPNITNWATAGTVRAVQEYHMHPDYKKPADADIAVLLMKERVIFGPDIRPVCVWDEKDELDSIVNTNGTVVGWGKDEGGDNYIQVPKQIVLPIVSQETCLRSDRRYFDLTSARTFCAGSVKRARGPCSGDSGSGFIIFRNGFWKLRGVVSIALLDPNTHMCDLNNYVVFSDVSKYIVWMQSVMDNKLI